MFKNSIFQILFLNFIMTVSFLSATDLELHDIKDMAVSLQGTKLISSFEGFKSTSYTCGGNKPTIGFGHVIQEWEKNEFLNGISLEKGQELLKNDIQNFFIPIVKKIVKVPLNQNEFDTLISFTYNLGATNLANSTLLKYLNNNQREEASLQFGLWRNVGGKYSQGLFKRRISEMLIFRGNNKIPEGLKNISTKDGNLMKVYSELNEKLKNEIQSIFVSYEKEWRN